jgi:DNA-binding transcriptional LysR family regulator
MTRILSAGNSLKLHRTLQVTDIGVRYYEHCLVILNEMDRASSMIDNVRTLPSGKLRISSPLNFAARTLIHFIASRVRTWLRTLRMLQFKH